MSNTLFKRVLSNAAVLFGGNMAASVIGAGALAINARALGPSDFGILAVVQSVVLICERVAGFDTWQPFVRSLRAVDGVVSNGGFTWAIRRTLAYDAGSALLATVSALIVVMLFGAMLGVEDTVMPFAAAYVATLAIRFPGLPTGMLRHERRFAWQAKAQVAESLLRLLVAVLLYKVEADLPAYFVAMLLVSVVHQSILWVLAILAWRRSEKLPKVLTKPTQVPGMAGEFSKFSIGNWVHSTANVFRQNADVILLGALGFAASVGQYAVAQRISGLIARAADAARLSAFPEINDRLAGSGKVSLASTTRKMLLPGLLVLTLPTGFVWLFGKQAIVLVLGDAYAPAHAPLLILTFAQSIYLAGFAVGPLVQLLVSPVALLKLTLPALLVSLLTAVLLIPEHGLLGAGASQVVFNVIWFGGGILLVSLHQRRQLSPASIGEK